MIAAIPRVLSCQVDAGASDADGDVLVYAASGLPAGLSINTSTGIISGTIGFGAAAGSPYAVSITVRDGAVVDATDTFTWTVTGPVTTTGITLRSVTYGSNNGGSLSSIGLVRPAGLVAGDVMLASIDVSGLSIVTAPSGWTLVRTDYSGLGLRKSTYVRVAGAAEPGSYAWGVTPGRVASGVIHAYSGVDTTNPVNASGGRTGSSSTVTTPSITTTVGNTMLVAFFTNRSNATWSAVGMSERGEVVGGVSTTFVSSMGADVLRPGVGATGQQTAIASSGGSNIAHLIALRPVRGPGIGLRSATYGSNNGGSLSSIDLVRPAGLVTGDVMLASIDVSGSSTITAPAGWTLVRTTSNGSALRKSTYVRVAGAAEPGSYAWGVTPGRVASGVIHAYSGVDTTNPVNASGGRTGSSSTVTTPSITTTVGNTMLVAFFTNRSNATWSAVGMSERGEVVGGVSTTFVSSMGADVLRPGVGATGQQTAIASSGGSNIAHLIALRPANL